jgi:hypothetical protein
MEIFPPVNILASIVLLDDPALRSRSSAITLRTTGCPKKLPHKTPS